jgi:AraC family transcriptional regulator
VLTGKLIRGILRFDQQGSLELYALLFSLLHQLPPETWNNKALDDRVIRAIRLMEKRISDTTIPNKDLADAGRMSVNGFARLFREQTGYTPHRYLMRMRIEKASGLLHHSGMSIETIASECGFSDRYYFTRIFSNLSGISPAAYRKAGIIGISKDH